MQQECLLCNIFMFAGNHHYLLYQNCMALHALQEKQPQLHAPKCIHQLLPRSAPSENLSSASSQLEDGPQSGIIITLTIISCGGGGGGAKHLV